MNRKKELIKNILCHYSCSMSIIAEEKEKENADILLEYLAFYDEENNIFSFDEKYLDTFEKALCLYESDFFIIECLTLRTAFNNKYKEEK